MAYPSHSKDLAPSMTTIYKLDDCRTLIAQVEAEGPVSVKATRLGKNASNALWMPGERTVYINISNPPSFGRKVRSIIFELHNALANKQFDYYDNLVLTKRISKEEYIQAIEQIEYENALQAKQIIDKGIRKGIFPQDAYWNVPATFEEHYYFQQQCGHSAAIGAVFEDLSRYSSNYIAHK